MGFCYDLVDIRDESSYAGSKFEVSLDCCDVGGEYVPWEEPKTTLLFECIGCGYMLEMFACLADEYVCPFCAQFMRCKLGDTNYDANYGTNWTWRQDSNSSDALLQQGYYI